MSAPEIRKWYFAVNEPGLIKANYLVEAAVRSCLANTPLTPNCIYYGSWNAECERLNELGVKIITHESSLAPELRKGYGDRYEQFAGHWLRADLPLLETEEDFVLYTDIDVIFRGWRPELLTKPRYFAAAPEHLRNDWSHFNSGVLVLNMDGMRQVTPAFHQAIRERLANNFTWPTHDQKSFNTFFADTYDKLDDRFNWKPYWGRNDDAVIIHFHGPKPHHIDGIHRGNGDKLSPKLVKIFQRDPEGYEFYCSVSKAYGSDHTRATN